MVVRLESLNLEVGVLLNRFTIMLAVAVVVVEVAVVLHHIVPLGVVVITVITENKNGKHFECNYALFLFINLSQCSLNFSPTRSVHFPMEYLNSIHYNNNY